MKKKTKFKTLLKVWSLFLAVKLFSLKMGIVKERPIQILTLGRIIQQYQSIKAAQCPLILAQILNILLRSMNLEG